jgi:site-specific recombinase XerC
MDCQYRARSKALWHAFIAANKGDADLSSTGNLRAVQLLLGHTKIESTVRYLGIEVEDALAIAEQIDV